MENVFSNSRIFLYVYIFISNYCPVLYLKSKKMKGGPVALSLHWPDLALVVSSVSLKNGPISVKERKVTVIVGHFCLKGKRAD